MAASIGAEVNTVQPTEADLVRYFEKAVMHAEGPLLSFHRPGRLILNEHVRKHDIRRQAGRSIWARYVPLSSDPFRLS